MSRYGAPFAGGWMTWPLRWLHPVETALNVYDTMSAVTSAMSRLKGDDLDKWNSENARLSRSALAINRLRDAMEAKQADNDETAT